MPLLQKAFASALGLLRSQAPGGFDAFFIFHMFTFNVKAIGLAWVMVIEASDPEDIGCFGPGMVPEPCVSAHAHAHFACMCRCVCVCMYVEMLQALLLVSDHLQNQT